MRSERRLLGGQRGLEATARRVETEFPELGSSLINLVQLSDGARSVPDTLHNGTRSVPNTLHEAFREAAVRQAATEVARFRFDRAAVKESRWRRFVHCMQTQRDLAESFLVLAALLAVALLCQRWLPNWGSAASRLLAPWEFVPSRGTVEIVRVSPGDTEVLVGDDVAIAAEIRNPADQPYHAWLFVTPEKGQESRLAMTADEKQQRYNVTVPAVLQPLKYRLEIGDSQTPLFTVGVHSKPVVESAEVTFHYPAYLGRKDETFLRRDLDLEAPQYSMAELRLRTASPVAKGYLESAGERFAGRVEEGGRLLAASMPLLKSGSYTVRLVDNAGLTDPNPRLNRITAITDQPPVVELLKPARQDSAAPGTELHVMIRAGDDHGVGRLQLEMMKEQTPADEQGPGTSVPSESGGTPIILKQWTGFGGDATAAVRQYRLRLDPATAKPGQTVLLRAVAWDKRAVNDWGLNLGPQRAESDWHAVKIVANGAEQSAALEQLESLRGAVWKLLEKQLAARTAAAPLLNVKPQAAADVRTRQIEIQKDTVELVHSVGPTDRQERVTVKRALSTLAFGEMLQAVARCDELVKGNAGGAAAQLTASQERIIGVLRKLLDVIRRAQADLLAEMKNRPGGNLPDDAKEKLEEFKAKLDKFLREQKKVVEASENLAKTPVDDFTKQQEELLKGLAAAEDQLSKLMQELHSDLSKLPEQDFANASVAKELVEIQTELKMAEDALLKKSVDIAVPLEQLGYERTEELKTNLEKWLPDTPDREKWSQEESLTDKDKEAPMAELPGELEDLVGDLMEQEEDLFDEMEDVSSSAADSIDKGAGWDAMDGPISNMSAKGVTGNRLPNKSEIGGRSGEGRQGKSSGEFVGDEAVGKGGRKTPSRLTPDPFVKGQIKDHSKEPTGGATGGGKESGKGGEGLEGPVPRSPGPRNQQRLVGRQAELRNKAQGVDLRMQVSNFHHTDLEKLIEIMSQVERDVKAGRYRSALRQRDVLLEGLGNVKQYLQGEFEVRRDTTVNLPADVQKEILGSMNDPSPAGWEELNRQYFDRLAGGRGNPAEKPAK